MENRKKIYNMKNDYVLKFLILIRILDCLQNFYTFLMATKLQLFDRFRNKSKSCKNKKSKINHLRSIDLRKYRTVTKV